MPNKQSLNYGLEANDVGMGFGKVSQVVKYTDFVDGLSADGTMTLRTKLPAYSFPIGVKVTVKTGFTGDTTAVLTVGTSTTTLAAGVVDADILTTDSNLSVYTAGKVYMAFATFSDGDVPQDDAQTVASNYVLLTITGGSNFTAISAGEMLVEVFYLATVQA